MHLERIVDRTEAELPAFEEVESELLAKWQKLTQSQAKEEFAQLLQDKYRITVANDDRSLN